MRTGYATLKNQDQDDVELSSHVGSSTTKPKPIPTNRRRKFCCICRLFFLISLGLLTYFLYPRIPTTVVDTKQMRIKDWGYNVTSVRLDVLVPVIIYNPNYIRLIVSFPKIEIYYAKTSKLLGRTKPLSQIPFPKQQNTTVDFEFVVTSDVNQTDIGTSLIVDCGIPPSLIRTVQIDLVALVTVSLIVNIDIPVNASFYLPCVPINLTSTSH